jgi:hypothetical protein
MKKRLFFILMLSLSVFLLLSAQTPTVRAAPNSAKPESFTATTGLEQFSSYRLNFTGEVDGTKDGKPSSGSLAGFLDVTNYPKAQHLRIDTTGDTFSTVAPLGKIEVYDINGTFYIQNPQSGSWITVPAFLVNVMLPDGVPSPEESIELPATAVPQPGTELVNGLVTQRYTFSSDDLAAEHQAKYDQVEGTIWVAVDGNYIVRYEATISGQFTDIAAEAEAKSGQFGNLLGGDLALLDEGTVTVRYELSDVDGNLVIEQPAGVGGFGFGWF